MPLIATLVDTYTRTTVGTGYTQAGAASSIIGNALAVPANYSGAIVYSSAKSTGGYTLLGSSVTWELVQVPARSANAQMWVEINTGAVNRVGFEFVAPATGTIRLDCVGQTTGYAGIGTTTQLTYNATTMRWLRLRSNATALYWETSPDGLTWTIQRTLLAAARPAWLNGTDTLRVSFEAFRNVAGTNDTLRIDNLNSPPVVTVVDETTVGAVTWAADLAGATAVAAGYANYNYNRQTTLGNGDASGLVWPPPTEPAPFGKTGRALMLRLPDGGRRHEVVPTASDYVDGAKVWVGFSFAIDADTPLDSTGYQVIWQNRPDDSTGSPPQALEIDDGGLVLTGGFGRPGASPANQYQQPKVFLGAITPRQWYRVVIYTEISSAPNSGRFDVWLDGVRVITNLVPAPGTNYSAGPCSFKNGAYHDPANRGMSVWFADHKHGTGYQAVAPPVTDPRAYDPAELLAAI